MKKKMSMRLRWLFLTIPVALLLVSCQKDQDVFIPYELGAEDLKGQVSNLLDDIASSTETFQWEVTHAQTFFTRNGSRLAIPANAFMTLDGSDSLVGQVEIKIREVIHKGEMIKFQLPAQNNGRLLETLSALHIEAKLNGQPLVLRTGISIDWDIPADEFTGDLNLYYGLEEEGIVSEWAGATEVYIDQPPVRAIKILTQDGESLNAYKAQPQQLGWWNCSRFIMSEVSPEEMNLMVELPLHFDGQNSAVYLVFENRRTVVKLNWNDIELDGQFSSPLVPVGEDIIVVAIAKGTLDRSFLGFENLRTNRASQTLTLPLFQRSLHTIQQYLGSL
ncbi:MAG: hypothetical protein HRU41_34940 [Saprospiraceae bacterium]|nr:hypothetical protein [Saprospiraceae bacterium]